MTDRPTGPATPEFARWLNGDLTRFCGKGYHESCRGTIDTIGITAPCLCKCHSREPGEEDEESLRFVSPLSTHEYEQGSDKR